MLHGGLCALFVSIMALLIFLITIKIYFLSIQYNRLQLIILTIQLLLIHIFCILVILNVKLYSMLTDAIVLKSTRAYYYKLSLKNNIYADHSCLISARGSYVGNVPANTRLGIPALNLNDGYILASLDIFFRSPVVSDDVIKRTAMKLLKYCCERRESVIFLKWVSVQRLAELWFISLGKSHDSQMYIQPHDSLYNNGVAW